MGVQNIFFLRYYFFLTYIKSTYVCFIITTKMRSL